MMLLILLSPHIKKERVYFLLVKQRRIPMALSPWKKVDALRISPHSLRMSHRLKCLLRQLVIMRLWLVSPLLLKSLLR